MRETTIAPPMPAAKPLKVKAATFIARVLMPDSRAASGLPPIAYSQRPNFVRDRTKPQANAATMRIQIEYLTPKSSLVPSAKKPWSLTVTQEAVGDHVAQAGDHQARGQRADERVDARVGDEQPVDEAAGGGGERGEQRAPARCRSAGWSLAASTPVSTNSAPLGEVELADDEQEGQREGDDARPAPPAGAR